MAPGRYLHARDFGRSAGGCRPLLHTVLAHSELTGQSHRVVDPAARFAGDGCFDLDLRADRATARSAAATSFRPGSAISTIRISTPP
ncbi:hypothetical protein [Methylorubrum extorquens]|uniref:hypothetical protein n=1 Tax=Methylorubrum extorquens TaxID=408 RepID=UPI000A2EE094|nr:hypothetical protein [Methylorubrum extorquens]